MRKNSTFPSWWESLTAHLPTDTCACGGKPSPRVDAYRNVLLRCDKCNQATRAIKVVDHDWLPACIQLSYEWGKVVQFVAFDQMLEQASRAFEQAGNNDAEDGELLVAGMAWIIAGAIDALSEGLHKGSVEAAISRYKTAKTKLKTKK